MPPRAKAEGLVANTLGPLPSLQDEKFIEQLLQLVLENDEASLVGLIALALGAEGHQVDLKHQIIVDTRLEFIYFCASQKYGPCKIVHLNKWVAQFRQMVEDGSSIDKLRSELLSFVASEIEAFWKWKQPQPVEEGAVDSQFPPKSTGKRGLRAAEKAVAEEAEAAAAIPRENVYLSKEDVGQFCTWLLHGIIQHASLYAYVAKHQRELGVSEEFVFFLETPMPAPPLRFASVVEKLPQTTSPPPPTALEEMGEQRAAEVAVLVNEYKEALAKDALWRATEQTERDMQLLIENDGARAAAEDTYGGLQLDLSHRQKRILQRVAALEKRLGIEPFPTSSISDQDVSLQKVA